MMAFLQSLGAFILALGILITFHEFGHYWVARKCDVKILRFSVGFGRPIWKRILGKDNTEFVVAALPLGGYVKMLDEREGTVQEDEKHRAFNNKPVMQRIAIVLAGPVFNFLFAIFAYWMVFIIGAEGLKPIVAEVDRGSLGEQAGFLANDEILQVEERKTPTWTAVFDVVVGKVVKGQETVFLVKDEFDVQRELQIDLQKISVDDMAEGGLLKKLGLKPKRQPIPAIIGKVSEDGAAKTAGLQPGDHIQAVNGVPVKDWIDWVQMIRAKPDQQLSVELHRGSEYVTVELIPRLITTEKGERIGRIGAAVDNAYQRDTSLFAKESYSIVPAFVKAMDKTLEMSLMTLRILGKMITGQASVKNLSGPISIAQYAGESASLGIVTFLGFLAIVSVSLGVLNLLPIPLLDGGHLLYYLVELLKGSPVSESTQIIGQQVGLGLLLGLMSLAFYNDILRLAGQ